MNDLYLIAAPLILLGIITVGYIRECRKVALLKKQGDAIDQEIEEVRKSTDELIFSAYKKLRVKLKNID